MTRKEREASEARQRAEESARDAGADYFKKNPELMLVEVHRYANKLFTEHYEPAAFVEGYTNARRQRDEYIQEQQQ